MPPLQILQMAQVKFSYELQLWNLYHASEWEIWFAERRWQLALEDPTASFWDRAVPGMQDDLMPILKVIPSIPISLLSPRAVSLDYSTVPP